MTHPWQLTPDGILLHIHLQPRASRNRVVGLHGKALKIALTAPPVEGAANTALLEFLAVTLRIPRSTCILSAGGKSRDKCVLIRTSTPTRLTQQLEEMYLWVDNKN
jgi:uncharacterized protein (TIGR00251 family)